MSSITPLKIGYFADGIWSHNAFKKIVAHKEFQICFITPRFDSTDETLRHFANTYNIPYIRSQNINSPEFLAQIVDFECDIFVSMSFNQIFKEPLISTPRLRTINCHAGKLPFYRGRNILNWALINDEKEFGISVHYVDSGIDTGDLILQRTYPICDEDDYSTLLHTAHTQCAEVLFEALCLLHTGKANPTPQTSIHEIGFYCPARIVGDEWIDWQKPSREIFNFIRAVNAPNLGAKTRTQTQEVLMFKAQMIANAPRYIATPGCIVGIEKNMTSNNHESTIQKTKPSIIVKTLDSTLRITHYQCIHTLKIGDRLLNNYNVGGGNTLIYTRSFFVCLNTASVNILYLFILRLISLAFVIESLYILPKILYVSK